MCTCLFAITVPYEPFEERAAAEADLAVRVLKALGVPRVVYLARRVGKVEQTLDLVLVLLPDDALYVADVPVVHADEEVVVVSVAARHLIGAVRHKVDIMLPQQALHGRIYRVAVLLVARAGGIYVKAFLKSALLDHIAEQSLGKRRTADIAVADEKYFYHCYDTPICAMK